MKAVCLNELTNNFSKNKGETNEKKRPAAEEDDEVPAEKK